MDVGHKEVFWDRPRFQGGPSALPVHEEVEPSTVERGARGHTKGRRIKGESSH